MRFLWLCATSFICLLHVESSAAGPNAGAAARLYWQHGTGSGLAGRNSTDTLPQVVVTVSNLKRFKGAEVQLNIRGLCVHGVPLDTSRVRWTPDAWRGDPGGCATGAVSYFGGGRGGAIYPNVFNSVPGVAQSGTGMYYQAFDHPCLTDDSLETVWFSGAGDSTVVMDSTKQYAVFAFQIDLTGSNSLAGTSCNGDMADSLGPDGVLIDANFHYPCAALGTGARIAILSDSVIDYVPLSAGYDSLTWESCSVSAGVQLSGVWPQTISTNGGTWITIYGSTLDSVNSIVVIDSAGNRYFATSFYAIDSHTLRAFVASPDSLGGSLRLLAMTSHDSTSMSGILEASPQCLIPELVPPSATFTLGSTNIEGIHSGGTVTEPSIAVGSQDILCLGPQNIRAFSKSTGALLWSKCLNDFFNLGHGPTHGCCIGPGGDTAYVWGDGGATNDPTCFYDRLAKRFLAACFSNVKVDATHSYYHIHIAVSHDSTAAGSWHVYHMSTSTLPDRPTLGVSADKVAIYWDFGTHMRFMDRDSLYNALYVPDTIVYYNITPYVYNFGYPRIARNVTLDSTLYVMTLGYASNNTVVYWKLTGPAHDVSVSAETDVYFPSGTTLVPSIRAPQKGSNLLLQDDYPPNYGGVQNPGDVYARKGVFTIAWDQGYQFTGSFLDAFRGRYACITDTFDVVRVCRVMVDSGSTPASVLGDYLIGEPDSFYTHPAVCDDSAGNVYLGFDASSENSYPTSYLTALRSGESRFEVPLAQVKAGTKYWGATQHSDVGRWGDFTSICLDETVSPPHAYYVGQWVKTAGANGNDCQPTATAIDSLGTWIRDFYFEGPSAAPPGNGGLYRFSLRVPSPNPGRGRSTIRFSVERKELVRIQIVSVSGRLVRNVVDAELDAGWHNAVWDGRDDRGAKVASGVYFCRLWTAAAHAEQKLVVLR